jgi:hypothetical protein
VKRQTIMGRTIWTDKTLQSYVVLLMVISVPFWILGVLVKLEGLPINIPTSALMAFNPLVVAAILTYRQGGMRAVRHLLSKPFTVPRLGIVRWLVFVTLMPITLALSYGLTVLTGRGIANPELPILVLPIMLMVFMVSAYGEEVGWQGYVFEQLHTRRGSLGAGMVIGIIWAVWHIIPYAQGSNSAAWIFWQCVFTVLFRLILVRVYTDTKGSVFAVMVVHASANTAVFLTPNYGSHYDPFYAAVMVFAVLTVGYFLRLRS